MRHPTAGPTHARPAVLAAAILAAAAFLGHTVLDLVHGVAEHHLHSDPDSHEGEHDHQDTGHSDHRHDGNDSAHRSIRKSDPTSPREPLLIALATPAASHGGRLELSGESRLPPPADQAPPPSPGPRAPALPRAPPAA